MPRRELLAIGLYTRVSSDRTREGRSIQQQDSECQEYASANGLKIIDVYAETSSAWREGIHRPEWERLLADATRGRIHGVLAWEASRFGRDGGETERLVTKMRRRNLRIFTRSTGEIRTALEARVHFSLAEAESDRTSERVKRAARARAEEGRAHGGRRAYGHAAEHDPITGQGRRGYLVLVPEEAAVIQEAATRVAAGESLYAVARDLREAGAPTASGGEWRPRNLGKLLRQTRLLGRPPAIPAILDQATFDAVQSIFAAHPTYPGQGAARHLLSGLARCDLCDGPMNSTGRAGAVSRVYRCQGCGRVVINATLAEKAVAERCRLVLEGAELPTAPESDRAELLRERQDVSNKLAEAEDARFVSGDLSPEGYVRVRGRLEARARELDRRLAENVAAAQRDSLVSDGLAAWDEAWATATTEQRRGRLRLLVSQIVIHPQGNTGRFDPTRIEVRWRA